MKGQLTISQVVVPRAPGKLAVRLPAHCCSTSKQQWFMSSYADLVHFIVLCSSFISIDCLIHAICRPKQLIRHLKLPRGHLAGPRELKARGRPAQGRPPLPVQLGPIRVLLLAAVCVDAIRVAARPRPKAIKRGHPATRAPLPNSVLCSMLTACPSACWAMLLL